MYDPPARMRVPLDPASRALGIARRRWRWIVVALLLTVALSGLLEGTTEPEYEATTTVILSRQDIGSVVAGVSTPSSSSDTLARSAKTQAEVASSLAVAERMKRQLGLRLSASEIRSRIDAKPAADADVLQISATASTQAEARKLSLVAATSYIAVRRGIDTRAVTDTRRQLSRQRALLRNQRTAAAQQLLRELAARDQQLALIETLATGGANLLSDEPTVEKLHPRVPRALMVGSVLGLALGFVVAVLRDLTDRRVGSPEEIAEALSLPVIAELPFETEVSSRTAAQIASSGDALNEAFRLLRTTVLTEMRSRGSTSLLVTSAIAAEGKTMVSAVLGSVLAAGGNQVRVIDADLRRPSLARRFGIPGAPGMMEMLGSDLAEDDVVARVEIGAGTDGAVVEVVPAGRPPLTPGEFVASRRFDEALGLAKPAPEALMLLDGPPLNLFADALAIAERVEGVVLVANLNRLSRRDLALLQRRVAQLPVAPYGVIVIGRAGQRATPYGYGYRYGYGAGEGAGRSTADV